MAFKEKEQKKLTVDQAWDLLYQRLEKDELLPGEAFDKPQRRHVSMTGILSIAAAVAACVFFGWYFMQKTMSQDKSMRVLYNEANAPTLATMLEDGSVVYLSERTSLTYPERFADDKREVVLQGEAFFEIKKQPERPFFIETEIASIEVTGTSFKIKNKPDASFLLSVREGEVRVTQKSNHHLLTVKAGETVLFDSEIIHLKKNTAGFDEFFTRIHFKDECLADVAAIINLQLDTLQLKIDPAIANRIITFTFAVNSNIAETAELICQAMGLHLSQQNHLLYISKPE